MIIMKKETRSNLDRIRLLLLRQHNEKKTVQVKLGPNDEISFECEQRNLFVEVYHVPKKEKSERHRKEEIVFTY